MHASIESSALTHRIAGLAQFSSIAGDSPAKVWLVRAGVWSAEPEVSLPDNVCWVPYRLLKHSLPPGAAGAAMLSLWPAGELPRGLADALVLRPLTLFGEPVGERVVVGDPSGAVFEPQEEPQRGSIHLCEHELDALALVRSGVTGSVRSLAVPAWRVSLADDIYARPVVIHARSPAAAERFKARLEAAGRACTVRPAPRPDRAPGEGVDEVHLEVWTRPQVCNRCGRAAVPPPRNGVQTQFEPTCTRMASDMARLVP